MRRVPVSSVVAIVLLAGCQTPVAQRSPPVPPPPPSAPVVTAKPARAGAPTSTRLSTDRLTQGVPRVLVYDSSGLSQPLTVVQDELPTCHCAGKTWWVRQYAGTTTQPAMREMRMVIDANGYIAVAEEIDRAAGMETVYTPPLVIIPSGLPAPTEGDASYAQTLGVVVHPLGDRSKVRASGQAVSRIRYEGDERLVTGAGEFFARRVVSTLTAELGAGRTVTTTQRWVADGVGMVCERVQVRATGAGVRESVEDTTLLLRSLSNSVP